MAPKQVTLANAGRKLTGPPEGYGRKKELQIKHWLTLAVPAEAAAEADPLPEDPTSPSELDDDVHQLYGQLRDSTDGFLQQPLATPKGQDARPLSPFPEQPQTPPTPQSKRDQAAQPSSASAQPTAPGSSPLPGPPMAALRAMSIGNNPTFDMDSDPDADHDSARTLLAMATATPPKPSSLNPALHPASNPTLHPSARSSLLAPGSYRAATPLAAASRTATPLSQSMAVSASARPLEFVLDSHPQWPQSVAIEAGLLLARMEASQPPGTPEAAVLKLALQAAIADKQQQQRDAQAGAAAAREGAAAAQQELQEQSRRARAAEEALGALRQELQQKQASQAESQRQDLLRQVTQLQAALAAGTEQLQQQAAAHQGEVQQLNSRHHQLQKASAAADHELTRLRTDSGVERSRLAAEVAELQQGHLQLESRLASALEQLRTAEGACAREAAARQAAEANERSAMAALQEHAAVAAELQAMQQSSAALQRRAQSAATRTAAAAMADPVKALLPAGGPTAAAPVTAQPLDRSAGRRSSLPRPPTPGGVRASSPDARRASRTALRPAEVEPKVRRSAVSLPPAPRPASAAAAPARAHSPTRARSPTQAQQRPAQAARPPSAPPVRGPSDQQQQQQVSLQQRPRPLRAMQQAVANERKSLAEAQRLQRRAHAQAELEESRQLQEALVAAPEHLRAAGLAFRAYVIAASITPGSFAVQLAAALAQQYRVFVDPLPLLADDAPGGDAGDVQQAGVLVSLAAAVVCVVERGCLDSPTRMAEMEKACVRKARLLLVCMPDAASSPDDALPSAGAAAADGDAAAATAASCAAVREYMAAAWEHRVQAAGSSPEAVAAAAEALAGLLGLPDADLSLLPPPALKRLGRMQQPDFQALNCVGLTSLTLPPLRAAPGSASYPHALLRALQGNTTLLSLCLPCSPAIAEAVAAVLLANQASPMLSITVGSVPLPVAPLLGRAQPPLELLDLSKGPFLVEDAAVLSVLLPHSPALARVLLPPQDGTPPAASAQLALALAAVAPLQSLNEVALAPLMRCAGGVLDLSESGLGPAGAGAVLHLLQAAPHAHSLRAIRGVNLTGCGVGEASAAVLCSLLASIPPLQLRALCLGDNQLGPQGGAALAAMLTGEQAPTALGLLELSVNHLGDEGCHALAHSLARLTGLERLALASNAIGPDGARPLCAALPSLPRLVDLQLNGNVLGDGGVAALAAALPGLTNLRSLSLAENYNIGQEGARALGAWLATAPSVTCLLLAKNSLGAEGARHLASGLRANGSLQVLDLEWCKLRAEGLEHIAGALEHNTSLQELLLSRNAAGDRGVKALVEAMGAGGGQGLVALDLRGNNIGITGCRLLNGLLQDRGCRLAELRMEKNSADEQVLRALEELAAATRDGPSRNIGRAASTATLRSVAASAVSMTPQSAPSCKPSPGRTGAAATRLSGGRGLEPSNPPLHQRSLPAQKLRHLGASKHSKLASIAAGIPSAARPPEAVSAGGPATSGEYTPGSITSQSSGPHSAAAVLTAGKPAAAAAVLTVSKPAAAAAEPAAVAGKLVAGAAPGQLAVAAAARGSGEQEDLEELLSRYRTGTGRASSGAL